ncbi:MAG: hypothetical protein CM1200mP39_06760 [Dehalococcoidia bacterium]|nr:MAG: hypothetical protein CM1200mP39_06760 [Dehalococcoidia bacterium]
MDTPLLREGCVRVTSPGLIGVTTLFGELATRMHDLEIPDWSPHMPNLGYSNVILELVTDNRNRNSGRLNNAPYYVFATGQC